ncbi:MAG: translation initiation factor IF-6 [Thermoplasmatales archaeon]|jgi:translation initiation factor 6|nr:translation initiation factor IF-6 [Candidatus Thermoplasmatota archaeon]MCL6002582.1 translation initiation factor IF-6 [Candidatus Thermoplasmatota archaeon]MDA8055635.1 translation initiation factor IF-6 [Thermoplasmatales archaeon]
MIQVSRIFNSPFLGVYLRTWEKYTLVPKNTDRDISGLVSHYLKTEPLEMTIGSSNLLGSLSVMNSNGMVFSNIASEEELRVIPKDINFVVLKDNLNAVGNNILVNDKAALVHEDFSDESVRIIRDVLGVEVLKGEFREVKTVGSSGLVTTSGLIIPPNMTDEEIEELGRIFGVKGRVGTANFGSLYVGASVVSNSKGALIGEDSTTVEISNIEEALNL